MTITAHTPEIPGHVRWLPRIRSRIAGQKTERQSLWIGSGLLAAGTTMLAALSVPNSAVPSSIGILAALLFASGTLLVGTAADGRSE